MARSIALPAVAVFTLSLLITGSGWADGPKPTVRKSVATFRGPTQKGTPRDKLVVRGDLSILGAFARHDAEADELFAALARIVHKPSRAVFSTTFAGHSDAQRRVNRPEPVRGRRSGLP